MRKAQHPIVAVTDADAIPPENWTEAIRNVFADPDCVFAAGLVKYPARSGFIHALETLDFYGLVASGAGAAGMGFPFMCNAANMAFRISAYQEVEGMTSHVHRSSGDDVLLLHRMIARYGRARIHWFVAPDSIVATDPAGSFLRYFTQRVRWASKGGDYRNLTAVFVAIVVLLTNAILVFSLVMAMIQALPYWVPLVLFSLKGIADLPLLWMVTRKIQQKKLLWWLIPTTIVYPFVTLSAGIAAYFWKPGWKGRKIR
jgi:cellulose synthase/poly-beta-1,6-N-acetylglucosamine synthase-like glycosyltransferase